MVDQERRTGDHDRRVDCGKEFERIWHDVERIAAIQADQGEALGRVETHIVHLVDSVKGLTQALWGIVLSAAGLGILFIIWFIQNGGGLQ